MVQDRHGMLNVSDKKTFADFLIGFCSQLQNGSSTIESVPEALDQAYRILLARFPDPVGYGVFNALSYPLALTDFARHVVGSEEFLGGWLRHIERVRGTIAQPITWHVHIPRTGGTRFAKKWLADGGYVFASPLRPDPFVIDVDPIRSILNQLVHLYSALVEGVPVLVSGHVSLTEIAAGLRPQDTVIATTRHPVERALSVYRYAVTMAQGGNSITGYPDEKQLKYFSAGWADRLKSLGLNETSTIREFILSPLCSEDELNTYLGMCDETVDLGKFLKDSGVIVLDQSDINDAERINSTLHNRVPKNDMDLLVRRVWTDIGRYQEIRQAYGPFTSQDLSS